MVVAAALVLGGGVAAASFYLLKGSGEQLLSMVPASTEFAATVYLDPSGGQKVNLAALQHKFPAIANDKALSDQVDGFLDQALSGSGLTHADVLPWLGSEIAVGANFDLSGAPPSFMVLIKTTDEAATNSALDKARTTSGSSETTKDYKGVTMHVASDHAWAVFDGAAVLTTDEATLTKVIDTSKGTTPALADDKNYLDTIAALPDGKLALAYLNPTSLFKAVLSAPGTGLIQGLPGMDTLQATTGIAFSVSAETDGIAFDTTTRYDQSKLSDATKQVLGAPPHDNGTFAFIPSGAYMVEGVSNLDTTLKAAIAQMQTLAPLPQVSALGLDQFVASMTGDASLEVSPGTLGTIPGGALVIGVTSPDAAQHTLDGLAKLLLKSSRSGTATCTATPNGVTKCTRSTEPPVGSWQTEEYQGATIHFLLGLSGGDVGLPGLAPAYTVVDGAAIVATSPDEIKKIIDTKAGGANITSSPSFMAAAAKVPGRHPALFIDVAAIVSDFGAALPPEVKANAEPVKTVVAGGSSSVTSSTSRLFIEIR